MNNRKFIIKNEYERVVVGEIYIPGQEDTDGNIMTAPEIKKACYRFMKKQRTHNIDLMHNYRETGSYIVENFLARRDDPDGFAEGSWVAAVKIESDIIWNKILKGEINCYSLAGYATNLDKKVEVVERVSETSGETFTNLDDLVPPHTHSYSIKFDENYKVIPTFTLKKMGHMHEIVTTSSTEQAFGHSHRYLMEND